MDWLGAGAKGVTGSVSLERRGEPGLTKGKADFSRNAEDQAEDRDAVDLAADWADISLGLRKDLGQQLFSQWIRPVQLGRFCKDTGTLDLFLPTEFSANWVADRFSDRLSLAWKIARSEVRHVRISANPGRRQLPDLRIPELRNDAWSAPRRLAGHDGPAAPRSAHPAQAGGRTGAGSGQSRAGQASTGYLGSDIDGLVNDALGMASIGLDPSLNFANFVTGAANVLACNAAQRMAATEAPQF